MNRCTSLLELTRRPAYENQGRREEAEELQMRVLVRRLRYLSAEHPKPLTVGYDPCGLQLRPPKDGSETVYLEQVAKSDNIYVACM